VADHLTEQQMTLRILNDGYNMPSFASSLKPAEVRALVVFLSTRKRTE
jgi:ubiquinol-cytochrome c reductase cytochrome b subunit